MLTTVAILVIVLGLMVSLARDVRNRSAERVTKDMLQKLDRMMGQYVERNNQALPPITPLVDATAEELARIHAAFSAGVKRTRTAFPGQSGHLLQLRCVERVQFQREQDEPLEGGALLMLGERGNV